ncbi:MAG: sodium:solute symporter family protein [Methanotrichaceae archaeon]|nr:sodium:solute symporter family protein [Methanotrichaceae archaeon]
MDPYHLFLLFLGLYIALIIGIGVMSSGRQRSVADFWLAGRELGAANISFSAAASWLSASALLLATGLFLFLGVGSIWVWVFPNIAALAIVAAISSRIKNIPAMTQPELLEIRYDPMVRAPVALAIAVMMILFSVVDFIGFKLVLGTFFGVPPLYAILIMVVAVSIYVSLGGFRAVVWTDLVQYIFLAGLAIFVALVAIRLPSENGTTFLAAATSMGGDWWNPFLLGGIMGAMIFQMALLPGWVAEQDPWQKIWAAKDNASAKKGLLLGAGLLALVYIACFLAAIGLSTGYPRPTGEVEAEMLYLKLISDSVGPTLLAVLTLGFAAASMSCTDTFATSGASCISRDLIQRHIRPQASMREMMVINRVLVVLMIAFSATIALNVESIMDAVIIATVIGTTSYFFPIIGGLYWKRATKWGALAALISGGGTQIALIAYEQLILKGDLSSISPLLTEHGVLVGLTLSAVTFVGVSLITPAPSAVRLAPFFPEVASKIFSKEIVQVDRENSRYGEVLSHLDERTTGERIQLNLAIDLTSVMADGAQIRPDLNWEGLVDDLLAAHTLWFTPTGSHVVYRLSQADMLSCVKMVRGDRMQIWLSAEPRVDQVERQRDEMFLSFEEIQDVLLHRGLSASPKT